MSHCTSCQADWSAGSFGADCPECGGGAMDHACLVCGGTCGRRWERAVMDSHDSREAHWVGGCGLPREEQEKIFQAAIEAQMEAQK